MKSLSLISVFAIVLLVLSVVPVVAEYDRIATSVTSSDDSGDDKPTLYRTTNFGSYEDGVKDIARIDDEMPRLNKVYVEVVPELQKASPGEWVAYRVVIKDMHSEGDCDVEDEDDENETDDGTICTPSEVVYNYKIKFDSSEGLDTRISSEEISLGAGAKETIKVGVKSDKEGKFRFAVKVIDVDDSTNYAVSSGVLVTLPTVEPKPPTPRKVIFSGDGFVLNADESQAEFLKLQLLAKESVSDNELSTTTLNLVGRAGIGNPTKNFIVKGTLTGDDVELKVYRVKDYYITGSKSVAITGEPIAEDMEDQPSVSKEYPLSENEVEIEYEDSDVEEAIEDLSKVETEAMPYATFKGTLKRYNTVVILKAEGEDNNGNGYSVTAFAKKSSYLVREKVRVTKQETRIRAITEEEIIPIEAEDSSGKIDVEKEVYIQPVKVYRKKILFIPYGKDIVETRIVEGETVQTVEIPEEDTATVGEYEIKVESAEQGNIELAVTSNA